MLGWWTATSRPTTASAQEKKAETADLRQTIGTPLVLPRPDFHFPGDVGRTYLDSDKAQFPQPTQPPKGAPNVVLILLDDAGFGQFSKFGGGVTSPTMDKLAGQSHFASSCRLRRSDIACPPRSLRSHDGFIREMKN
jgi:arylsulfatase